MAVVLLWTGCEGQDDISSEQTDSMTLSICLPADEVHAARMCGPRRVMGDPGTTELFELPKYVYIIIMKKAESDPDWSLWEVITEKPAESDWTKKRYGGVLATAGDSIYQYNVELSRLLAAPRFDGRVYIIASAVGLTFDKTLESANLSTKEAVETLRFASMMPKNKDDSIQANLQHIYSTPYNYAPGGEYYGEFKKEQRVPHLDMVLYHVAAKVDITWNVADSARVKSAGVTPIRLTRMDACNLFNDYAYCFKPMENSSGASPLDPDPGTGDTINIVSAGDVGLWWEGRSYFYTIPYTTTGKTGYFPLQMRMETNGSGAYYRPTIYLNMGSDKVFVPWMRATFNIKKQLTAGTAVMEAG